MGVCCYSTTNSEHYIRSLLKDKSLSHLTKDDLTRVVNMHVREKKSNLISKDVLKLVIDDIVSQKYVKYRDDKTNSTMEEELEIVNMKEESIQILKILLINLYSYIDLGYKDHLHPLYLILFPIINTGGIKQITEKIRTFFYLIKNVKLTNDKTKEKNQVTFYDSIKYSHFCETFLFYLSVCLSGYSKALIESLEANPQYDYREIQAELKNNCNDIFTPGNIRKYYQYLIEDSFTCRELSDKNGIVVVLAEYHMSFEQFNDIFNAKSFLLSFDELRENYFHFVNDKKKK
jgi:hypothetical protein